MISLPPASWGTNRATRRLVLLRVCASYHRALMEWEGKIVSASLVCSASGARLAPGESFFSGLRVIDGQFTRAVFAALAWEQQDKEAFISWWRQKVPQDDGSRQRLRLDADSLEQLFVNLRESRSRVEQCLAYVVALALVRAKRLIYQTVVKDDAGSWIVALDKKRDLMLRIRDPQMTKAEEEHVLKDLLRATGLG